MPGFKRRQAHLVSHYTRNDFSRLLVSRHAALGRVSKVSIQNSSCFTHSLFPLERNSGRLFSTWTCVSSNKAHHLCRCQNSFDLVHTITTRTKGLHEEHSCSFPTFKMSDSRKYTENPVRQLQTLLFFTLYNWNVLAWGYVSCSFGQHILFQ